MSVMENISPMFSDIPSLDDFVHFQWNIHYKFQLYSTINGCFLWGSKDVFYPLSTEQYSSISSTVMTESYDKSNWVKYESLTFHSGLTLRHKTIKCNTDVNHIISCQGKAKHVNSSPTSAAYMRQWTAKTLLQVMACHLFGAKPLPEPMMTCCQL